jgi:hypothetical protein
MRRLLLILLIGIGIGALSDCHRRQCTKNTLEAGCDSDGRCPTLDQFAAACPSDNPNNPFPSDYQQSACGAYVEATCLGGFEGEIAWFDADGVMVAIQHTYDFQDCDTGHHHERNDTGCCMDEPFGTVPEACEGGTY